MHRPISTLIGKSLLPCDAVLGSFRLSILKKKIKSRYQVHPPDGPIYCTRSPWTFKFIIVIIINSQLKPIIDFFFFFSLVLKINMKYPFSAPTNWLHPLAAGFAQMQRSFNLKSYQCALNRHKVNTPMHKMPPFTVLGIT